MFLLLFSILVVLAVISSVGEIVMRVRLTQKVSSDDKLEWWRRGGDEVGSACQELFPNTRLPFLRRVIFWLLVASSLVILSLVFLRKS